MKIFVFVHLTDELYWLGCDVGDTVEVFLMYVDKNVTVKGTDTYGDKWNVSLKKGWNYFFESWDDVSDVSGYTASQTLPNGSKWVVKKN